MAFAYTFVPRFLFWYTAKIWCKNGYSSKENASVSNTASESVELQKCSMFIVFVSLFKSSQINSVTKNITESTEWHVIWWYMVMTSLFPWNSPVDSNSGNEPQAALAYLFFKGNHTRLQLFQREVRHAFCGRGFKIGNLIAQVCQNLSWNYQAHTFMGNCGRKHSFKTFWNTKCDTAQEILNDASVVTNGVLKKSVTCTNEWTSRMKRNSSPFPVDYSIV